MLKLYSLATAVLCTAATAVAQPLFTNASAMLPHGASSGGCMAVADMDGDGRDDIVQLDMSMDVTILYQNADHTFTAFDYGSIDNSEQWGWAIADVDNNGHKDILSGVSSTNYMRITSRGVYTLTQLDGPSIFTQCMSMADMNSDGRVDVYACNDVGPNNIWFTNASGVPINDNDYIDWSTNPASDMSGNYGSTFTDFDNDGDIDLHISHCRQGVNDPDDPRRWDRLFVNDGTDHYVEQAAMYGLQNREQVWTTDFGDYDNDGDLDAFSTTHSSTLMLFENDGTGHFTNVTAGSGLQVSGFFLQGLLRDMDNDGFLDALTASSEHYYKGNGDGTFVQVPNMFPADKEMHSFAFGDLNQDGFTDVYASYGDSYVDGDPDSPDRLWLNTPNGNHWFNVNLEGVQSNKDAVGAKVTITGPWGTQVREVHAGESYGLVNTFTCHFGLGGATEVETMTIHWPSGLDETFTDLHADQTITVVEGTCISPNAHITSAGTPALCTGGGPLDLTATSGFTYLWNTGAATQGITVDEPGTYTVAVSGSGLCVTQAAVTVTLDPDETPSITAEGPTTICELDQVVLTASPSSNYTWSNGSHDPSITVSEAGSYTVAVNGACDDFTSDAIAIEVLDAPGAPASDNVEIPAPGTAELTATGDGIVWYDAATGGTMVGEGSPWTTPFLNNTTFFWCAQTSEYGGGTANGGRVDKSTIGGYQNNSSYYLLFEADEDMVINSVKVYANGAGTRQIAVVDPNLGTTIASGSFSVPNGESRVDLDFTVPAGGPYGLRIVGGDPQLWRDQAGSNPVFPYALGTLGSILSSNVNGNSTSYYYFFYDWEVSAPVISCMGPRTEVEVTVGPVGIDDPAHLNGMRVYPNPASDLLMVSFTEVTGAVNVDMLDVAGRLVLSERMNASATGSTLSVKGVAPGEYTLRVRHGSGTSISRIVVR